MKIGSARYKSILIAIALLAIAFGGLLALSSRSRLPRSPESKNRTVRIPYAYEPGDVHFEPREIRWSFEYDFVNNLFGMLLRRNKNNDLVTDLPERMEVGTNTATFYFGERAKTTKGIVITAKAAELSIKRLFMREDPKFSWIRGVLCDGKKLQSVEDACSGLNADAHSLTLKVRTGSDLPQLLSALSSPDFGIAPEYQIDRRSGELSKDFSRDTSGPYSLVSVNAAGELEFGANKNSQHYSPQMLDSIKIVPSWSADSIHKFLNGELDILPMDTYWGSPEANAVLTNPKFNIYESLPSRVSVVQFTKSGLRDFTPAERIFVGDKIAKANMLLHPQPGARTTVSLLQAFSDGALTSAEISAIDQARRSRLEKTSSKRIRFGIAERDFSQMKALLLDVPEVEVVSYPSHPSDAPEKDWPDAMTMVADVSSNDVLSMVTSYLSTLLFVPGLNQNDWLKDFVSTPSRKVRDDQLRELHFKSLMNGSSVPIVATPFFAATLKNLHFEANKVQPTMDMWTIRRM